jgi:hypothetical protein
MRWVAIPTLGLCASHDTSAALEALPKAEAFIGDERRRVALLKRQV